MYKSMEVQKDKAIISFDNIPNGLMAKDKNITALYMAGADKIFYPAIAKIVHGTPFGENDKLIVSCNQVPQPVAIPPGM